MKSNYHRPHDYRNENMNHWTLSTKNRDGCRIRTSFNSRNCFRHDAGSSSYWTMQIIVIRLHKVWSISSRCRQWSRNNHRVSTEKRSKCWDYQFKDSTAIRKLSTNLDRYLWIWKNYADATRSQRKCECNIKWLNSITRCNPNKFSEEESIHAHTVTAVRSRCQ